MVLRQEGRQISTAKPGEPAIIEEVIYVDTEESLKLHGILSKALQNIPFFAKNPSLLAINRTSAIIHMMNRIVCSWNAFKESLYSLS